MDVDTAALAAKFATLWFVDADPLAAVYWRKCAVPLRWDVCDVSGVIKDWVRRVETTGGGWKQVLNQVRTLPRPAGVAFTPIADGIVSLNLLSQIPIVWQELLEQHLNNRFGVAFVKKQEQHWMDAMIPGARWLVEEHLKTLARTGARNILLIADLNYAYYRNAPSMPLEGATAPLAWDSGEWSASVAGVKFEVADSLFGVRLDDGEMFRQWMPGYEMDWRQIWLWHISPLGLEYKKRGTVHRVGAFALRKKATGGA